jgi:hypothetical protein
LRSSNGVVTAAIIGAVIGGVVGASKVVAAMGIIPYTLRCL